MLNHLKGTIVDIRDQEIIIELNGMGFSLLTPQAMNFKKGALTEFYLYMHWNQEQGPSLYGFATMIEKKVFLLVISCSGIGPKIALALLSQMSPAAFIKAVSSNDLKALSSITGIGPKKAEQLLVQLRHKIAEFQEYGDLDKSVGASLTNWKDISDALGSLHYSRPEITKAMLHLQENYAGKQLPFDELLRHALSFLAKRM